MNLELGLDEGELTIEEAEQEYGVPAPTLRRWAASGYVQARKRGKKLWLLDAFDLGTKVTPVQKRRGERGLRREIQRLIEKYKDDANTWSDDTDYLERDVVVDDLKELLET